jgi:hypothetical protein
MLLIATAILAGPVSISAALLPDAALAQCAIADRCSMQVCQQRHRLQVHDCNRKRSCVDVSERNRRKLNQYLMRNEECLDAREDVARCFSVINKGHQDAIDQAENAIRTCRVKLGLD